MSYHNSKFAFKINKHTNTTIFINCKVKDYLSLALNDLINDIEKIIGVKIKIATTCCDENTIIITQKGEGWENYSIKSLPNNSLEISGSDCRSIMFAIYDFIEIYLEVDPFYWWSGVFPQPKDELFYEHIELNSATPSFKFRGWFINDEDLLSEFKLKGSGKRNIDYRYYSNVIHQDIVEKIAETAVRAKFNLIIPESFVDIDNEDEKMLVDVCSRRGLFISMHHIEPLGVSAFAFKNYWKKQNKEYLYSYYSNPDKLREVWKYYAKKWAVYENVVWQIGLRGIGDRPIWDADSSIGNDDANRAEIINNAMAEQVQIITEAIGEYPEYMTSTLWAEGAVFFKKNLLKIPDKTILVFADNCAGWRMQQDYHTAKLLPNEKYGVYYHHAIICGTHLTQAVPPICTWQIFKELYERGVRDYAIFNVSNIREFIYGISASSRITRDVLNFSPSAFLEEWISRHFSKYQEKIAQCYEYYFNSFELHPETKVAMFTDGIICNYISRCITLFEKGVATLDSSNAFESKVLETSQHVKDENELINYAQQEDAFLSSLSDMLPHLSSKRRTIQLLGAQALGFERTLLELEDISGLSESEELFLFDQLRYPASFMFALSKAGVSFLLAREAFINNNKNSFKKYLEESINLFDELLTLSSLYCHGKWESWYIGCKKCSVKSLNIQAKEILKQFT